MGLIADKILQLSKLLYPTGRAFKMSKNTWLEKLHRALSVSEAQAFQDCTSILNNILPDNDLFTLDDATDWERRLGLITNTLVPLADRKAAILRKMNHPGNVKARQHYLYLQGQLQLAGFNVFIHENIPEQAFEDVLIIEGIGQLGEFQLGEIELGNATTVYPGLFEYIQLGTFGLGENQLNQIHYLNKVVNHITESEDAYISIGENYRSCFFVGGEIKGTFADVSAERKKEFRQLILKLKPVQTIGLLIINYN